MFVVTLMSKIENRRIMSDKYKVNHGGIKGMTEGLDPNCGSVRGEDRLPIYRYSNALLFLGECRVKTNVYLMSEC